MSYLLVAAQFVLIPLLAWPFTAPAFNPFNLGLFALGILVGLAALVTMGAHTISVLPEPRAGGALVTHGVYRLVRHPMYLSVLLCGLAACLAYQGAPKWALLAALALVLAVKIRREERLLRQRFAGYAEYARRTRAILPLLL
jgi:protein-S-isoprenylcysteine O-methyltransferase Ste14